MIKKQSRTKSRQKRHYKIRRYLSGTAACPRLAVFRSNKHIYAQVIDDTIGHTLASSSTMDKNLAEIKSLTKTSDIEAAKIVGTAVAKKALDKGIKNVVFDRGGCIYHGKIAALADAAREAGLAF